MKKEIEYRGYNFTIEVELNATVGLRTDEDRWHKITTTCKDLDNLHNIQEVSDRYIGVRVEDIEGRIKEYIDDKIDVRPSAEERLSELGFK